MHSCDKEQGKATWGDWEKPLTRDRCNGVSECADFSSQRSCTAGRDDAQSMFTMQGKPIRNGLSFIFTKYVRAAHHDRRAEAKNNRSLRIQHHVHSHLIPGGCTLRFSELEALPVEGRMREKKRKKKRGLPRRLCGKESACKCRRHGFDPWSGRTPHATEHLSPCTQLPRSRAQEPHQDSRNTATKSCPGSPQPQKSPCSSEDPAQPKINTQNYTLKKKKKEEREGRKEREREKPHLLIQYISLEKVCFSWQCIIFFYFD